MHENMNRVESAVSATRSGNLTWEQWPHDCATALGFAGQRNPLGFAVVRYISAESSATAMAVILHLATALIKKGHAAKLANDAAWAAVDAWNHVKCPYCTGRGVLNIEQNECPDCHGTGHRDKGALPEIVRDGMSALMEAERWMEGQLAKMLRGTVYAMVEPEDRYKLRVQPLERGMVDVEIDSNLPSGLHGRHDSGG